MRRAALHLALRPVTHVLNEGNMPFAMDPHHASFAFEVAAGFYGDRRLGVVFHGSEARGPALAKELDEASYFFDADPEWVRTTEERTARNRREVADLGVPVFVTTPDLLAHVPGSTLLPISVDAESWRGSFPAMQSTTPRVLHRGSGGGNAKGSAYILPVLEDLARAGRIELVRPAVVRRSDMAALIRSADIVVDQLQTGTYGVTGIEALAAGRVVVANISAHLETARDRPPMIDADPQTFRVAMEDILDDPDSAIRVAQRGPEYVRRWHDGREAARVLSAFVHGGEQSFGGEPRTTR